jgi:hypothetical protein
MIRLAVPEGEKGNVSIVIKRETDLESHLANGKYKVEAQYSGYRGDSEEIKKTLGKLSNEGSYPVTLDNESQHDKDSRNNYFARELVTMMDKVKKLDRQSKLGLIISDLNDGWNTGSRDIAGILEKQHGINIVPEDRIDYEIRKPIGHLTENSTPIS